MFDLTQYNKVYVPSLSNSSKGFRAIQRGNGHLICIKGESLIVTENGKLSHYADNPMVFPYTQEWYEKLKLVYPDLEPYKDEAKDLLTLLEERVSSVACKVSNVSYDDARKNGITVFKDYKGENLYFIVINPFTLEECKTVEDYFKVPSDK